MAPFVGEGTEVGHSSRLWHDSPLTRLGKRFPSRRPNAPEATPVSERLLSAAEHLDVPYYLLRWSDAWNRVSLRHLRQKWALDPSDPFLAGHHYWLTDKRVKVLGPAWTAVKRLLGHRGSLWAATMSEGLVTGRLVRRHLRRRAAHGVESVAGALGTAEL